MKWSLNELYKYREEPFNFSDTIDLKESLMKRDNEILDASPIHFDGILAIDEEELILHMNVSLELTLPSARSLEPVNYPMAFTIDEIYIPRTAGDIKEDNEDEVVIKLEHDWIDLTESIEDSVLLHLPLQVFTEEEKERQEMPSGENWTVISEEDYFSSEKPDSSETIDPRLAGLKDFFKDDSSEE
ncbi:YceD family protein [Pisciglobus halotolerans]|uniref:Uncharacterized protein n=1 Tax=Pisciglobus halotolerans TaxID=745365 RepID=A0A1I3BWN1_9LACT|nr:YceD family protein [Pisciglobus halotolerans]SFH66715.1 uncharacterized protein SAMN04489868_11054 [Pisciglobus halotolerans]